MPVQYNVDSNLLTDPPSHYPRVAPVDTLNLDQISALINLHNPTVPKGTAKEVIELFIEELKTQIVGGKWVNIDNFCSFSSSMINGSMEAADDTLPSSTKLELRFKPSSTYKSAIRDLVSFERIGYTSKQPSIIAVRDTMLNVSNIFQSDVALSATGQDIGYNTSASDEGLFLQMDGGSSLKLTNIARNKPSNIIAIPSVTAGVPGSVAAELVSKTRYTSNGNLKTSAYGSTIRLVNEITVGDSAKPIFKPFGVLSHSVIDAAAAPETVLFTIKISPQNELIVSGQAIVDNQAGLPGAEVILTEDGFVTVTVGATDYNFGVVSYTNLFDYVNTQGNFIQEVLKTNAP